MQKYRLLLLIVALVLALELISWLSLVHYSLASLATLGSSDWQFRLLAAWCVLLLSIPSYDSQPASKKRDRALITLASAFLISLLALGIFFHEHQLNVSALIHLFANDSFSTTRLQHAHIGKAPSAFFVQYLLNQSSAYADYGLSVLAFCSPLVIVLSALATIISALALIYLYRLYSANWSTSRVCLFLLVSFSIVKSFADGGPFSEEMFARLAFLPVCFLPNDRSPWKLFFSASLLLLALTLVLSFTLRPWHVGQDILSHLYMSILPLVVLLIDLPRSKKRVFGVALLLLISVPTLVLSRRSLVPHLSKLMMEVPAGNPYYFLTNATWDNTTRLGKLDLNWQVRRGVETTPEPLIGLYQKYGIPKKKQFHIQVEGITCELDTNRSYSGEIRVYEGVPQKLSLKNELITLSLEACEENEWCTFRYRATLAPCVPNSFQFAILHSIHQLGLEKFILKRSIPGSIRWDHTLYKNLSHLKRSIPFTVK